MGNICDCYDRIFEDSSEDEDKKEKEEEEKEKSETESEPESDKEESEHGSAGDTEILRRFTDRNIIVLESRMSEKTLFFNEGRVEATGDHGPAAQFIVHVRAPGIVALQNNKNKEEWLQIKDDIISPNGRDDPFCSLSVKERDDKYVSLESVLFPGQRVGVNENDEVERPSKVGKRRRGHFIPIVKGVAE